MHLKLTDGSDRYPTVNIGGTFRGTDGDKVNTVPARVTFSIDRRITPNEDLEFAELELREAISGACQYYPDLVAEARAILRIEPCLTDIDLTDSTGIRRRRAQSPFQSAEI